ncbi:ethanolamine ammonia-lyase subunit EutC [Methylophaga sp.]|uniref:ethanolamine ammonia-lyase subunit EutC n=1 Tax=Methylophaga sp. TaxID=2024840 RepID=UPI002724FC5F|nr:ethanolamine ammonia-lyase subunit EutC [Methylophaga sp.]MDO8828336.1 ethanolamine ammonia-lyase subunit EutC [Methylophaga sp.]
MVEDADMLIVEEHLADDSMVIHNPWRQLRQFTAARIGIGRAGVSTPTRETLEFQLAHAQARDAVHTELDVETLQQQLLQLKQEIPQIPSQKPLVLHSRAIDRVNYLQRPDYGRQLDDAGFASLKPFSTNQPYDLALVIADGLSATAIHQNAVAFISSLLPLLLKEIPDFSLAPISLVNQGRVAIGDDIGEALNARAVLILIGERPGLSSPDSLGLYLTWSPKRGLTDDKRNCISNVRLAGLSYAAAAHKCLYLLSEARRLQCSGVAIKDRSTEKIIDNSAVQTSFLLDSKVDRKGVDGK